MNMVKLTRFAISPAKMVENEIVLNCCSIKDTKHPSFRLITDEFEDYCLTHTISLGQKFLYQLEHHSGLDAAVAECGVGTLKKRKKDIILERQTALIHKYESGPIPARDESEFLDFPPDTPLCVTTFYPKTLEEATLIPNTLWFSGGLALLEEDGILLWVEGELSPAKPEKILKFLSKSSAQLSVGSLQVKPVKKRPTRSKKGTIIFNEITEKFEGYDGKKWRNLNWEED